jgi:hypothetical protein
MNARMNSIDAHIKSIYAHNNSIDARIIYQLMRELIQLMISSIKNEFMLT